MQKVGDVVIESINDITIDVIIAYCQEKKEVDWLKACASEEVAPDKRGRIRKKSFIEIRKEFVVKFMPEFAPKYDHNNKPTMYDKIAAL